MKIEQHTWTKVKNWAPVLPGSPNERIDLVLLFGEPDVLRRKHLMADLRKTYPRAHLLGCSTAGEICGAQVHDGSAVITAIAFESTKIRGCSIHIGEVKNSFDAGARLAEALRAEDLIHVFVLSDGLKVNGSELVAGLTKNLPDGVAVTGGLSGDGERFKTTLVLWDSEPEEGVIAALGFYGKNLSIGYGSLGGWDPFGPERLITRAQGNVLYELDGKSALELYKRYLGDYAKDLPAAGLLFPLLVRTGEGDGGFVRTILSVNEKDQSMTFAGDVPQGAYARLMKANFDRLIDGATGAARINYEALGSRSPDLAVLISCVGRKLVLKQRTEEEVEAVREVLGHDAALTGFYSYGEISPLMPGVKCDLHNQTMTITTFSEA